MVIGRPARAAFSLMSLRLSAEAGREALAKVGTKTRVKRSRVPVKAAKAN